MFTMFGKNIQVETVKITKEVKETDVSMEKEGPPNSYPLVMAEEEDS